MGADAAKKVDYEMGRVRRSSPTTVEASFDDQGFTGSGYSVSANDTLKLTNLSTVNDMTVYILAANGQSTSNVLLGMSNSQVYVAANTSEERTVSGTGNFCLSLKPPPQDPPSGDPSGTTIVIIVST